MKQPTALRSRIMRSVRGKGNISTELAFAGILRHAKAGGWRRHLPLTGRPDFSWPSLKVAVFVDGCFWHGCPRCYRPPKTNRSFWIDKIEGNRRRDRRVTVRLRKEGWKVIRIWECRVDSPISLARLQAALVARIEEANAKHA